MPTVHSIKALFQAEDLFQYHIRKQNHRGKIIYSISQRMPVAESGMEC